MTHPACFLSLGYAGEDLLPEEFMINTAGASALRTQSVQPGHEGKI